MKTIYSKGTSYHNNQPAISTYSFFYLLLLFIPISLPSQIWETQIDDHGESSYYWGRHGMDKTSDGFVITGTINNNTGIFLTKVDTSGQEIWRRTYTDSSENLYAYDVVQTVDGGFAIIGRSALQDEKGDIYLIKTDEEGHQLWTQYYDLMAIESGRTLLSTDDNGLLLAGYTSHPFTQIPVPAELLDIALIKIDEEGTIQWKEIYDAGTMEQDVANDIIKTNDGGYLIVSKASHPENGPAPYLIKLDKDGTLLWEKNSSI